MKRTISPLFMLLAAAAMLVSCLDSNDNGVAEYSDTAITGVTLGTLNRYTHTTSSKTGNDTIIKTTLTGSSYKLTIDQLSHTIYNQDSLPVGTDLKHVTLSALSTKNSGVAFIKSPTSDTLFYISSTDSLDFTYPRTIRVMATNGIDTRDYTMTLSASTTTGTTFGWQLAGQYDDLAGWTDKKLTAFGDTVVFVDNNIFSTESEKLGGKALVRISEEGMLEYTNSIDATAWTTLGSTSDSNTRISRLLGATPHEVFALGSDGGLKVSSDGALREWRDEVLDDTTALLPTTGTAMVSWNFAPADNTDYVLLAGVCESDTVNAATWRKLTSYYGDGRPTEGTWVYMPIDGTNHYAMPRQDYLSMTYYDNRVIAIGSDMKLLESRDQGITWKSKTKYSLPAKVQGSRASIAADNMGRLWLFTDSGQLWMGKLL